ncbi:inositol-1-monophosphatase (plasmid) [Antarctobacter heliothermus]|uniref:Inositol-1-monophosphatase n=1 Tax=Antarctobacter heliothermus TaxID=74033 RepID=A0A222EAX2_9RHOB|nr:inositol monophosphatase [Antarctobacter heliothermus]ASP23347.1 inositol-1-monophosphatase [Antarctobacter heliothermus]
MTDIGTLEFATALAQEAGHLAQTLRANAPQDFVATKGKMDFITHADRASERLIRERIAQAFPGDTVLGEEEGGTPTDSFWIVDPIDGTTNYLNGLPDWGVCIARVVDGVLIDGVITCPDHQTTATATRGQGAYLNGVRILPRHRPDMPLVQLGYSPRAPLPQHLHQIGRIIAQGADYRRSGAACTGLLSIAAGWSDVYYEKHLNLWDAAPGLLLIAEAGGTSVHTPIPQFARHGSEVLALGSSMRTQADLWQGIFAT